MKLVQCYTPMLLQQNITRGKKAKPTWLLKKQSVLWRTALHHSLNVSFEKVSHQYQKWCAWLLGKSVTGFMPYHLYLLLPLHSDHMWGVRAFTILCPEIKIIKSWVSQKYDRKHRWEISLYWFMSVRNQYCLLPWCNIYFPDGKCGEKRMQRKQPNQKKSRKMLQERDGMTN